MTVSNRKSCSVFTMIQGKLTLLGVKYAVP